jgi:hypothetical protein
MFDKLIGNCIFLPWSSRILSISLISESKCLRSPPNDNVSSDWRVTWHILYICSTGQLGWLEERLISTRQNSQLCHIIPGSSLPPLFTNIIFHLIDIPGNTPVTKDILFTLRIPSQFLPHDKELNSREAHIFIFDEHRDCQI